MLKKSLKLFSAVVFAAVTVVCLSSFIERGEGSSSGYSCTVTVNCYDYSGRVTGTVSCTSNTPQGCQRGDGFVICDGYTTHC